jgi:predicted metal-dependent hydrolase
MSEHQLKFGSATIHYSLEFKDRKTLGIKVYPDCTVKVIAPIDSNSDSIQPKLKAKAPWILKQLNEFLSYHPLTPPRKYITGETHLYLGKQYKLKLELSDSDQVKLKGGQLIVFHKKDAKPKDILEKWYRAKAIDYFTRTLNQSLSLFSKYSIEVLKLEIRKMSKRWGSCTYDGTILLNSELIKAPKGCIEYVVIHELCHLIHHNHTKPFYELQQSIMPDWKKWKDRLERSLV